MSKDCKTWLFGLNFELPIDSFFLANTKALYLLLLLFPSYLQISMNLLLHAYLVIYSCLLCLDFRTYVELSPFSATVLAYPIFILCIKSWKRRFFLLPHLPNFPDVKNGTIWEFKAEEIGRFLSLNSNNKSLLKQVSNRHKILTI